MNLSDGLYFYSKDNSIISRNHYYNYPETFSIPENQGAILHSSGSNSSENFKLKLTGAFGSGEFMIDEEGSPGKIYNISIDYQLDGKFIVYVDGKLITSGTIADPSILTDYYLEFHTDEYSPNVTSIYTLDEIKIEDLTFTCGLADINRGYNTEGCNVDTGNIIQDDCNVVCADEYTGTARASCNVYNGNFEFSGCQNIL